MILDLVPSIDGRGSPSHVISDPGSNFNAGNTQTFVNNLGVTWHINLPLAPWHGFFFRERLVRSAKELLMNELKTYKLTYEQLQAIVFEIETIINSRPITYFYNDESESCLTPNHLLFGRTLLLFNSSTRDLSYPNPNTIIKPTKLQNIMGQMV